MKTILLCSDLDRTLIPNGPQAESPQARPVFRRLAASRQLRLAYVSGRDRALVETAIQEYGLPVPDFVIGDVGTTLYRVNEDRWHLDNDWQAEIGQDWQAGGRDHVDALVAEVATTDMTLQPPEKQGRFKVSFFTAPSIDHRRLKSVLSEHLAGSGMAANIIWSLDEADHRGLLDILPRRANKLHAIRFLMQAEGMVSSRTVFAGDSGNDLDVLTSGMQAVLVKNASGDVRRAALDKTAGTAAADRLYAAKGLAHGMNGNYAAGVIEGVTHFFPETSAWIQSEVDAAADQDGQRKGA